jgi:methyl-accepting chemotaxis protein
MRRGNEEVEDGIQMADRAGAALQRIVAGTDTTVDMVAQIAAASEEQSTTSEQIARSVEMISTASDESAGGISMIAQSAGSLGHLTDELRTLLSRFRIENDAAPSAGPVPHGDGHAQAASPVVAAIQR